MNEHTRRGFLYTLLGGAVASAAGGSIISGSGNGSILPNSSVNSEQALRLRDVEANQDESITRVYDDGTGFQVATDITPRGSTAFEYKLENLSGSALGYRIQFQAPSSLETKTSYLDDGCRDLVKAGEDEFVSGIGGGETRQLLTEVTADSNIKPGNHDIELRIEPTSLSGECASEDNGYRRTVYIPFDLEDSGGRDSGGTEVEFGDIDAFLEEPPEGTKEPVEGEVIALAPPTETFAKYGITKDEDSAFHSLVGVDPKSDSRVEEAKDTLRSRV